MTDIPTLWLARLRALTVAERPALLAEMSRHEVEAVLLRLAIENDRLRECRRCAWCRLRRQHDQEDEGSER